MYFFVIDNSLRLHVIIFDLLKVEEHRSISGFLAVSVISKLFTLLVYLFRERGC